MKRTLFLWLLLGLVLSIGACSDSDDGSQDNPISGTWRITEVQVSQQQLTQFSPTDETITISFATDGNFTGETTGNQFQGRYELEGITLTMLEFSTLEAGDTPFGLAFYGAITEAQVPNETFAQFGYSFDSLDLILVFGNSGRMILEKQ